MASHLTSAQEKQELNKLFNSLDSDKDGKLSRGELVAGFATMMSEIDAMAEIEAIMLSCDIDANGFIDYNEFVTAAMDRKKLFGSSKIEECFRQFDIDGSGTISASELKTVLGNQENDIVWEDVIKEVDQNGDGEIDIDEFKAMLLGNR